MTKFFWSQNLQYLTATIQSIGKLPPLVLCNQNEIPGCQEVCGTRSPEPFAPQKNLLRARIEERKCLLYFKVISKNFLFTYLCMRWKCIRCHRVSLSKNTYCINIPASVGYILLLFCSPCPLATLFALLNKREQTYTFTQPDTRLYNSKGCQYIRNSGCFFFHLWLREKKIFLAHTN